MRNLFCYLELNNQETTAILECLPWLFLSIKASIFTLHYPIPSMFEFDVRYILVLRALVHVFIVTMLL